MRIRFFEKRYNAINKDIMIDLYNFYLVTFVL